MGINLHPHPTEVPPEVSPRIGAFDAALTNLTNLTNLQARARVSATRPPNLGLQCLEVSREVSPRIPALYAGKTNLTNLTNLCGRARMGYNACSLLRAPVCAARGTAPGGYPG
jgi:hypothetical protein